MSFALYIGLVTLGLLLLRWVLFEVYERKPDSPSFLRFMLDPNGYPHDERIRWGMIALFLIAAGAGFAWRD